MYNWESLPYYCNIFAMCIIASHSDRSKLLIPTNLHKNPDNYIFTSPISNINNLDNINIHPVPDTKKNSPSWNL